MSELFWRNETCTVRLGYTADGALEFSGHDRAAFGTPGHEYEYYVTVPSGQFPSLRAALGVDQEADLLTEMLARVDEVMHQGEVTWLERHGIERSVRVWQSPPD